jgi:hypothetical protein
MRGNYRMTKIFSYIFISILLKLLRGEKKKLVSKNNEGVAHAVSIKRSHIK